MPGECKEESETVGLSFRADISEIPRKVFATLAVKGVLGEPAESKGKPWGMPELGGRWSVERGSEIYRDMQVEF